MPDWRALATSGGEWVRRRWRLLGGVILTLWGAPGNWEAWNRALDALIWPVLGHFPALDWGRVSVMVAGALLIASDFIPDRWAFWRRPKPIYLPPLELIDHLEQRLSVAHAACVRGLMTPWEISADAILEARRNLASAFQAKESSLDRETRELFKEALGTISSAWASFTIWFEPTLGKEEREKAEEGFRKSATEFNDLRQRITDRFHEMRIAALKR